MRYQKRGVRLFLKTVQFIKVNGSGTRNMVLGFKFGLMELDMKVTGLITKLRGRANFGM